MPKAFRIACLVLGLLGSVYGISTVTGGWLGEPVWWRYTPAGSWFRDDPRPYYLAPARHWHSAALLVNSFVLTSGGLRPRMLVCLSATIALWVFVAHLDPH